LDNIVLLQEIISRAKIRSVKLTLVVIMCYILCSAPFVIGQIMVAFGSAHIRSYLGNDQYLQLISPTT
jgi:hypothetical protein